MTHGRRAAAVATVLVASALALAPSSAHAADGGRSAKARATTTVPTTDYAVGSRSVVLVDASRPTDPNRDYPGAPDRTHGHVVAAPTFPLSNGTAPGGPKLVDYVDQPAGVSFIRPARSRRSGSSSS